MDCAYKDYQGIFIYDWRGTACKDKIQSLNILQVRIFLCLEVAR